MLCFWWHHLKQKSLMINLSFKNCLLFWIWNSLLWAYFESMPCIVSSMKIFMEWQFKRVDLKYKSNEIRIFIRTESIFIKRWYDGWYEANFRRNLWPWHLKIFVWKERNLNLKRHYKFNVWKAVPYWGNVLKYSMVWTHHI